LYPERKSRLLSPTTTKFGDKVGDVVETTDVGNGTTEKMPAVDNVVMVDPLIEGWTDEGTRDTDIVDDAKPIKEVVKITADDGAVLIPIVLLFSASELVLRVNRAPVGASSADIV
jgi:hypothetical protein